MRRLPVALLAWVFAWGVAGVFAWTTTAQAADPRAGRRLAGARCAVCHGNDGIAVQPDAPNLAGQNPAYLAAQLGAYRSGARQQEQMTLMAQALTDAQIADLAAWYAAIEVTATVPGR